MDFESENKQLRATLQKAGYYLNMFARGKRLYNLNKKEQTEFKLFMELAFNS